MTYSNFSHVLRHYTCRETALDVCPRGARWLKSRWRNDLISTLVSVGENACGGRCGNCGAQIRSGDIVTIGHAAANRDPARFDHPDALDITRRPNRHVAFGHGIHYCVGVALARIEGVIAISSVLRRMPKLKLMRSDLKWKSVTRSVGPTMHGVKT